MTKYIVIVYDYLNGKHYITTVHSKNERDVRYDAVDKVMKQKNIQRNMEKYFTVTLIYEVVE